LAGAPGVRAVAVVPRSDDVMGEVGVAVVVSDGRLDLEALRAYAGDHLAAYKLPEDICYVDALPLTAGDKVDRKALAQLVT
jgi:acyl-CoA synthetase (AMP-forming)/AMP-acid ligase II